MRENDYILFLCKAYIQQLWLAHFGRTIIIDWMHAAHWANDKIRIILSGEIENNWGVTELWSTIISLIPVSTHSSKYNDDLIELDWIEEYQWVDPPRLWEAISGEGCIQKWSHFQLDSLFSPRPCTKVMGRKARWQPPIFVSCLLIGPNGFTPLFRSSSMAYCIRSQTNTLIKFRITHILQLTSRGTCHSGSMLVPNDTKYNLSFFFSCSSIRCWIKKRNNQDVYSVWLVITTYWWW